MRESTALIAGMAHKGPRGTASYSGVLRATPQSVPLWRCPHDHLTPPSARACAEAELDRRKQGGRQVLTLLHCEPESLWFADARGSAACPRCSVPLLRVKLAVLERGPVVDPRQARR